MVFARSSISAVIDQIATVNTAIEFLESGFSEMTDPDFSKLWANPTLGAAANGVFLDVMEAQIVENRAAEVERRPARIVKRDQRFPGWEIGKQLPSNYTDVSFGSEFDDGSPVEFPQGGPEVPMSGTIQAAKAALIVPVTKAEAKKK